MTKNINILSIDAWREYEDGWTWNSWRKVGAVEASAIPATTRGILRMMRELGFLSDYSKGRVCVEDDQYNLVICDRHTLEPLFAIEYGAGEED